MDALYMTLHSLSLLVPKYLTISFGSTMASPRKITDGHTSSAIIFIIFRSVCTWGRFMLVVPSSFHM